MATSERHCFQTMIILLNLVADLKMRIDFSKSWCWAATKSFRTFWIQSSVLLLSPEFEFTVKSHVHDLGCTISYNNTVVLGPLRDKIDNAVAKRNRLRRLQQSLEERAEKLQTAVWPAVFYRALGLTIGDKHFTTLRRAAANVLVGEHKHASSAMAYLPKGPRPIAARSHRYDHHAYTTPTQRAKCLVPCEPLMARSKVQPLHSHATCRN